MSPIARAARRTFSSLRVRNYRLFLGAQLVSITGTWMQWIAQSWLVLRLTDSGVAVGVVTALQFLPMLLGGLWAGLIADRFDKRMVLVATQGGAGLLALVLGVMTATGTVDVWSLYAIALGNGIVTLVDTPARQAFVTELVGPERVANAVGLNSAVFNAGRVIGPAIAALLIASVGLESAFFLNAVSYVAVVVALLAMDRSALYPTARAAAGRGRLRETMELLRERRSLRHTILLLGVIATFGFNFTVLLPLLAKHGFHGGAGTYGLLTSVMSAGGLLGALTAAGRQRPTMRLLVTTGLGFSVAATAAAVAPTVALEVVALIFVGATSMAFITTANSLLQLRSPGEMRGRVMSLYALVFLGSTAVGGPIAGALAEAFGPRAGIAVGAAISLVAAVTVWSMRSRNARRAAVAAC